MIRLKAKGDYKKAFTYFERVKEAIKLGDLDKFGQLGIEALKESTPVDTGKTADSWIYDIERTKESVRIVWSNTNVNNGVNIAILLQYGHGTNHGGYVIGKDYINPAIQPVFDKLAEDAWKEVTKL